jgi:hypothetical protein
VLEIRLDYLLDERRVALATEMRGRCWLRDVAEIVEEIGFVREHLRVARESSYAQKDRI